MSREKQFNVRLSEEELEQVRQLAISQDRSVNSYIRSLIRQAWNKSLLEIPAKKPKKTVEYAQ